MKRVTIAVALAMTMLFGSSAFAGGKSIHIQLDSNVMSVNWSGHYQRGKQYHRRPQHWQKRRVAPRRNIRHGQRYRSAPRRIYRAPRRIYRAPQRIYRAPQRIHRAPTRIIHRPAPRRHYKRYVPRRNQWHHQKRRVWRKH